MEDCGALHYSGYHEFHSYYSDRTIFRECQPDNPGEGYGDADGADLNNMAWF
jgi:hypothetical protein